jgi:hypothetical protein
LRASPCLIIEYGLKPIAFSRPSWREKVPEGRMRGHGKWSTYSLPQNTGPVHSTARFILEYATRRRRVSTFRVELLIAHTFSSLVAAIAGTAFAAAAPAGWKIFAWSFFKCLRFANQRQCCTLAMAMIFTRCAFGVATAGVKSAGMGACGNWRYAEQENRNNSQTKSAGCRSHCAGLAWTRGPCPLIRLRKSFREARRGWKILL